MYTCNMLNATEKYAQFLKIAYIFDNLIWLFVILRQETALWDMEIHIYCNSLSWTLSTFRKLWTFFCQFLPYFPFLFVRAMTVKNYIFKITSFAKLTMLSKKLCLCTEFFCSSSTWDEPISVFPTLVHVLAHGLRTHDD